MSILGGIAINWVSQLELTVALSTAEAGYMAITETNKEMICL